MHFHYTCRRGLSHSAKREALVAGSYDECQEADREDTVVERSSEVLPHGGVRAGVVGREQQGHHIDESECAGQPDADSRDQRDADGEFSVGDEKRDGRRVRQDEPAEYGNHERVGSSIEEAVDPELKSTVQRELRPEDLVLAEDQEEASDGDTQKGER